EKIILEWPSYLNNGKERKSLTYWELLTMNTGMDFSGNKLTINGNKYDCRTIKAGKDRPEIFEDEPQSVTLQLPTIGRRALKPNPLPLNLTHETVRPSLHEVDSEPAGLDVKNLSYASSLDIELDLPSNVRGTLLHRCFEVFDDSCNMEILNRATGFDFTHVQFAALRAHIVAFNACLQRDFAPQSVQKEVAVLALNDSGSVINGFVDLLVETEEGFWIIDHKSDQTDDLLTRFSEHLPQLLTYQDTITKTRPEKPVLGVAINWISSGNLTLLEN
ncbi:PD-(D/E)XK nuclease family protein, partial [bacterium]|nr:PD-(D/E)XK nuclease family protein [bacterium]